MTVESWAAAVAPAAHLRGTQAGSLAKAARAAEATAEERGAAARAAVD